MRVDKCELIEFNDGTCIFILRLRDAGYALTELQLRGGIEDNSKKIFLISQQKHML